jgi:3-methyl-2-oxobutanoate hydroxymethyltransferase
MEQKKVTVPDVTRMKARGERITMVTAYDYAFARLLDEAGVDVLLVGDSLGMVVQGLETTLPVTLDEMIYHTRMVARGRRRALLVADLPFGSYQTGPDRAVESAVRLVKEGAAEVVKLEGGTTVAKTIEAITRMDVPVMGHVGPDTRSRAPHGRASRAGQASRARAGARERLIEDACAVEEAGAFAVVLEGDSARPGGRDHRDRRHPDHRHRRRRPL